MVETKPWGRLTMPNAGQAATVEDLHRQLADAKQAILALANGEVDALVLPQLATPLLLHQAQEELRRREKLFSAIFDGVGEGLLLVDSAGIFLDANPAVCELFGVQKDAIVGRRTEDFAAAGYDATAERQRIASAGRRHGALPIMRPDGTRRELEYSVSRDILPGVHLSVLRDVTERRRAEVALVASERKYRQIVDTAREGIWLIDEQARTTFTNRALEEMFGYESGAMLGKSTFDFMDEEGRAAAEASLKQRREGVSERREQKYLRADGTELWVLMEASSLSDDAGKYSGALAMVTDITERRRAEAALRASEERYRLLFTSSPLPIWLVDSSTLRFLAVNRVALQVFGYERDELLNMTAGELLAGDESSPVHQAFPNTPDQLSSYATLRLRKRDGALVEVALTSQAFALDGRQVRLCIAEDMTQRNRLEAQLAQARKMEAIGILAGGVAHDFNNLLSIIVTYTSFALDALKPGDVLRADIQQVAKAGERAVGLTRQLLAFSRQQILQPRTIDLNATIVGIEPMLRRLLPESIEISLVTEAALGNVSADPGQLEQVIMNLVVNARDAMPGGGELTIETANVAKLAPLSEQAGQKPGAYVKLVISDTGSGIDAAAREHIFEPFFTTKEVGKGTGLGLSTVLGIVEQSGGYLEVRSELGKGTSFDIFLPRVDNSVASQALPEPNTLSLGGSETVLVVEDDDQVRALTRTILRRNGYEVLVASNAGEAFLIAEEHPRRIHLLLTDVVMPRMNGRQLAERLAVTRPDMKILFMTGYTDDPAVREAVLHQDVALLQKPITPLDLARRVRSVLDAPSKAAEK
jgi:two-component system, cell cycle sensor histidine kinase and response regulator CckA